MQCVLFGVSTQRLCITLRPRLSFKVQRSFDLPRRGGVNEEPRSPVDASILSLTISVSGLIVAAHVAPVEPRASGAIRAFFVHPEGRNEARPEAHTQRPTHPVETITHSNTKSSCLRAHKPCNDLWSQERPRSTPAIQAQQNKKIRKPRRPGVRRQQQGIRPHRLSRPLSALRSPAALGNYLVSHAFPPVV